METPPKRDLVVAVIGAGPAGLMAAQTLAAAGSQVDLYEYRRSPARKFVLAGRSGLNLTNSLPLQEFVERIDDPTGVIADCVRAHSPEAVQRWSADLGHGTFVGSSGRVFPRDMRATPLLRTWLDRLGDLGVKLHVGHRWTGWTDDGAIRFDADDSAPLLARPDATILALGGASWPLVSSAGEWVQVLDSHDVAVNPLRAANAGILVDWSTVMIERFEGTPVKGIVAEWQGRRVSGDLMVTRSGLEGTPVYTMASRLGEAVATGQAVSVHIDLAPDRSLDNLRDHLANKRRDRDSFATWMRRSALAAVMVALVREATGNTPPGDPAELAALIKALPLDISGVAPVDRAISSAGGVALARLGPHLALAGRPGTFVAGEMLDFDAPTGGWLLQIALSTGVAAAHGALALDS